VTSRNTGQGTRISIRQTSTWSQIGRLLTRGRHRGRLPRGNINRRSTSHRDKLVASALQRAGNGERTGSFSHLPGGGLGVFKAPPPRKVARSLQRRGQIGRLLTRGRHRGRLPRGNINRRSTSHRTASAQGAFHISPGEDSACSRPRHLVRIRSAQPRLGRLLTRGRHRGRLPRGNINRRSTSHRDKLVV
jgi:hypothetical protein